LTAKTAARSLLKARNAVRIANLTAAE